jgi:hypothetical protein
VRYRTIWISDVHLGTRQCDAETLLTFLETLDGELQLVVPRMPAVATRTTEVRATG